MSEARVERRRSRAAAAGHSLSRAERFALRLRGEPVPGFDAMAAVPLWRLRPEPDAPRIALAAGLLHLRRRIDGELSGARLLPLVEACGETLFDRACAAPPPPPEQCAAPDMPIPDAEELLILGRRLLDDPAARALASRAAMLVEEAA
jgi:hypothetical protein